MKDFRKRLMCLMLTISLALVAVMTADAETMTLRVTPSLRTSSVTAEKLLYVTGILRQHSGEPAGGTVQMYSTGITVPEGMSGDDLAEIYRFLTPSRDVVYFCTEDGRGNVRASATDDIDSVYFRYSGTGERGCLWVGFRPNAVPSETMAEIDAAMSAAAEASASAPQGSDAEKYAYFFSFLLNRASYDDSYGYRSYNASAPLLYGKSVCQGYATAFALLCLHSGLDCYTVRFPDIGHIVNAVPAEDGGIWIIDLSDARCDLEAGRDPWSGFMAHADAEMTAYVTDFRSGMDIPRYR